MISHPGPLSWSPSHPARGPCASTASALATHIIALRPSRLASSPRRAHPARCCGTERLSTLLLQAYFASRLLYLVADAFRIAINLVEPFLPRLRIFAAASSSSSFDSLQTAAFLSSAIHSPTARLRELLVCSIAVSFCPHLLQCKAVASASLSILLAASGPPFGFRFTAVSAHRSGNRRSSQLRVDRC